jgi:hypothetical protein
VGVSAPAAVATLAGDVCDKAVRCDKLTGHWARSSTNLSASGTGCPPSFLVVPTLLKMRRNESRSDSTFSPSLSSSCTPAFRKKLALSACRDGLDPS